MIQSNVELVEEIAANINKNAENMIVSNVEVSAITDVPVQFECVKNYNDLKTSVESFKEVIQRDANSIVDIAYRFDEKDEELASDLRG